jgi:hypothetical protein
VLRWSRAPLTPLFSSYTRPAYGRHCRHKRIGGNSKRRRETLTEGNKNAGIITAVDTVHTLAYFRIREAEQIYERALQGYAETLGREQVYQYQLALDTSKVRGLHPNSTAIVVELCACEEDQVVSQAFNFLDGALLGATCAHSSWAEMDSLHTLQASSSFKRADKRFQSADMRW